MSKTYSDYDDVPLTPSQLVSFDNVGATESMPYDMSRRLAHQRLYLSSADEKADLSTSVKRHACLAGSWEIDLPAKGIVGLPGRTGELVNLESASKSILGRSRLDGFRPPWADHVFHPKLSGPDVPQDVLRRFNGSPISPHSVGIFGSDDRKPFYPSGYPWQCIGRLFTWKDSSQPFYDSSAAAVLVGPRHVLTAAHATPYFSQNWKMLFVPGYFDGSSVVGTGVDSWVSDFPHVGSIFGGGTFEGRSV